MALHNASGRNMDPTHKESIGEKASEQNTVMFIKCPQGQEHELCGIIQLSETR